MPRVSDTIHAFLKEEALTDAQKAAIREDIGAAAEPGADDNYVTDAEKTKLANLSGTNTGDETQASILEKVPILTRTAAVGAPTNGSAGYTLYAFDNGVLFSDFMREFGDGISSLVTAIVISSDQTDTPAVSGAWWAVEKNYSGPDFDWRVLYYVDGVLDTTFISDDLNAESPELADWTSSSGTMAVISVDPTATSPSPAFTGQRCIVGDDGPGNGNRLIYQSLDGSTWTLTGPPGVQDAGDGINVIVTTYSGDVPTHTLTAISDYLTA